MLIIISVVTVAYPILLVLYRLYWHPLSKFPGPCLAAATKWYECYFDLVKWPGGQFAFEIRRMHQQYGPIVRINPDEIHINHPDWYDNIYAGNPTHRNKWPPAAGMSGTNSATFGTVDHNIHRRRRAALSPKFSKKSIDTAEEIVREQVQKLADNFERLIGKSERPDIRMLYLALTTDSVCQFAFGEPLGIQDDPQRTFEWAEVMEAVIRITPWAKQFPWALKLAKRLPPAIIRVASPALARFLLLHRDMKSRAALFLEKQRAFSETHSKVLETCPRTIFDAIHQSTLPEQEKSIRRLAEEGFLIIGAGSETSAKTLVIATYHLLTNPRILEQLQNELTEAMPQANSIPYLQDLKDLPWLTAIIKESLRMSSVITARLPVNGPDEFEFENWIIPPWTPVSLTINDILFDPSIFPEPHIFDPQRWLGSESLDHFLVTFSRGTRMCLGKEFAYMEIYLTIATIFRRFELQLYETIRERDIDFVRDSFVGRAEIDSPGVRIKVIRELQ